MANTEGCHFSAGLSVFRAYRKRRPGSGDDMQDEEDEPSTADETVDSESCPGVSRSRGECEQEAGANGGDPSSRRGSEGGGGAGGSSGGEIASAEPAQGDDGDANGRRGIDDDGGAVHSPGAATASLGIDAQTPAATAVTAAPAAAAIAAAAEKTKERNKGRAAPGQPCLWLEAMAGCLKGQTWVVEAAGATLGRASDNKLSLADKEMSRRHSKIEYDESRREFYLCDLGSLNGTYMQLVGPYAAPRRLGLGDHLLIGRTGFSINRFDYGISERMGARPTMEDRSIVIQDLDLPGLSGTLLWPQTFAAVYDGHGGGQASEYLWTNLHTKVASSLASRAKQILAAADAATVAEAFTNTRSPGSGSRIAQGLFGRTGGLGLGRRGWRGGAGGAGGGAGSVGVGNGPDSEGARGEGGSGKGWEGLDAIVKDAISEAFAAADNEFIATSRLPQAGSTATTCLVLGPRVYMANVGDSRTLLCRGGKLLMATEDHKPSRPDEQERVQRAGGFVAHRRVMGELAVSRAFGDSEFKGGSMTGAVGLWRGGMGASSMRDGPQNQDETEDNGAAHAQLITAEPEFLVAGLTPQDQFLVLGCDGVFDVLSSEEVVAFVYNQMKIHADAQRCCEDLTEQAIVEKRTRDNVSLVLIILNKWF